MTTLLPRQPVGTRPPGVRRTFRRGLRHRWWPAVGEALLAPCTALGFAAWAATVGDSPVLRVGQVSGLAALQFRLALCGIVLLALVGWGAAGSGRRRREAVVRLCCAAAAGLGSGMLAGGLVFALHGTSWPLLGQGGDNVRLIAWTDQVLRTGRFHNVYPPGIPHLAAWIARYAEHDDANAALKPLFLTVSALTAPAGYLAWRTVVRPFTALAVALAGAYALNSPEKPYPLLALVLVVPLLAKTVQWLRLSPGFGRAGASARGAVLGLLLGLVFLLYAGQHVWSFPAYAVLLPAALPWRAGRAGLLRGALLLAGLGAGFLAVGGEYLRELLGAVGTHDTYCSSWTLADPAAIGRFPLTSSPWPLLLAGTGAAIALGLRTPAVGATLACFGGAWLLRFYLAHRMAEDADVHLFTHSEAEVQYSLVVLTVLGAALAGGELRRRWGGAAEAPAGSGRVRGAVGLLFCALLFCGVAGSAATDSVLAARPPAGAPGPGNAAWIAQHLRNPCGRCSRYAVGGRCVSAPLRPVPPPFDTAGRLRCPPFGFR